ncbi:hypothetical protein ACI3QN_13035, partial [Propionibacterium freudenreichii]|uniref:hypothetical protein n=1 Tax=Propionibacterium freudenreichii TaxID=1744 RepID=UPI003854F6FC
MSEGPAEWIERVLGIELWESQKHIIAAITSGKRMSIDVAHNKGDAIRLARGWFGVWYLATTD